MLIKKNKKTKHALLVSGVLLLFLLTTDKGKVEEYLLKSGEKGIEMCRNSSGYGGYGREVVGMEVDFIVQPFSASTLVAMISKTVPVCMGSKER